MMKCRLEFVAVLRLIALVLAAHARIFTLEVDFPLALFMMSSSIVKCAAASTTRIVMNNAAISSTTTMRSTLDTATTTLRMSFVAMICLEIVPTGAVVKFTTETNALLR